MSLADVNWLRPLWLLGFIPWVLVLVYWWRGGKHYSAWEQVVDPALRPYVIEGSAQPRSPAPLWLFAAWALALLMLAGPVWKQQEVPVFQAQQAEVVLLDLSSSMLADDIAPDRLTRARFKLSDLLARSAGRPYVISPLTEDTSTIEAFLPSLHPDIMPVQGSRLDLAVERAVVLLEQTGVQQGHILYIGDQRINQRDIDAVAQAREQGHRVSVIAVGTSAGKPLRDENGQFVRDASGAVVVPQIDMSQMRRLADSGGGRAVMLTTDSQDLDTLSAIREALRINVGDPSETTRKVYWVEYAPLLVWPLMLVALLLFRRGVVA